MATDSPDPILDAPALVGLLSEPDRLRVVAALVLGAVTIPEIRTATGLDGRSVGTALSRLVAGELVVRSEDGAYYLVESALRAAAASAASKRAEDQPDNESAPARALRAFLRKGRLVSIPVSRSKRLVLLDLIAQDFEPGQRYSEREVNATIRRWHDDTAALRRYLVDESFLERDDGVYWRVGGSFPV